MSRTHRTRILPLLLALTAAPLTSCILVAGAGVGYVVSQNVLPNDVHVSEVADDVDTVWSSVTQSMEILVDPGSELLINDIPRSIQCKVDGAKVKVEVEAFDIDRTTIRVQAEKYLAPDNEAANDVMNTILRRLQE